MTPIQKLAKLALDNPELRDDLMPIIRQAGTWTPPKGNWVLYDLAVQDAHKGKPDREWYRKDEGYTEVYDQTIKEIKSGRRAGMWQDVTGPPTTAIYENKIDHGYDQALGGGTDVMKRLQDQFLIEQGREPRDKNPRLAGGYREMTPQERALAAKALKNPDVVQEVATYKRHPNKNGWLRLIDVLWRLKPGDETVTDAVARHLLGDQIPSRKYADADRLAASSPEVTASIELQASLIGLLNGPNGRSLVKTAVIRYAAATDTTVVVNAAVEDIINNAVAVALDPQRMGQVIARHTAKEQ